MSVNFFFKKFVDGLKVLYERPVFVALGLLLGLVLTALSGLGGRIAVYLQTTPSNIAWVVGFGLVSLSIVSYFSSGIIGLTKKEGLMWFFKNGNKFWLKNLGVFVVIFVSSMVVWAVAHYGAIFLGKAIGLEIEIATVLFVLIYFAGLTGFLIFLSFASFFLVLKRISVREAISKSGVFVKNNYIVTLSLLIVFFVLYSVLDLVGGVLGDLIAFGFLFPYFIIVFKEFVK